MTTQEWDRLKKKLNNQSFCPFCGRLITEGDSGEDLVYSKAKNTHIFIHKRCLSPQGGNHAKK